MGGLLLGEYTMRSFGEYPSEEKGSRLSQILEVNPLPKYSLSAKACQGILRRAERRGKTLPEILKNTLMKQSAFKSEAVNLGVVRESLSSENTQEHCQRSTTNQYSPEKSGGYDEKVYCLQGNGIDRADTAGCNGKGWRENESYTLNTIDRPAVAYSFDSLSSNSMKSSNPHSGCHEVEVAKTLDCTIPEPSKNQGGVAVVFSQDAYDKYAETEKGATVKASGGSYGGGVRRT